MAFKYIFIVGLSRTGGKWTLHILEQCRERPCAIVTESFFLGRAFRLGVRQKMRQIGDMRFDANVCTLVDAMYSGEFGWYGWVKLLERGLRDRHDELLQRVLASDRSDKAIYQTLLQVQAGDTENAILGDKSGVYLHYVPTLLEWFPEAKIIHTFRDPRAVLASHHKKLLNKRLGLAGLEKTDLSQVLLLKLPEALFSLLIVWYVAINWRRAARLHRQYWRLYPENYYLLKYEDLVCKREESVRGLCSFLGIEFHELMLELPPRSHSSFALEEGGPGFDTRSFTRWQTYLKPWMKNWLSFWTGSYLSEFGF
ncbi:MAG: sulfotransferase [Anaerolineae bacterium]|nr:sulfotransferase [Anaerolineae bacterium]